MEGLAILVSFKGRMGVDLIEHPNYRCFLIARAWYVGSFTLIVVIIYIPPKHSKYCSDTVWQTLNFDTELLESNYTNCYAISSLFSAYVWFSDLGSVKGGSAESVRVLF